MFCRCMRGGAATGAYGIGRMYRVRTCLPARDACAAVPCSVTQCHAMQCNVMFIERTEFHMQIQRTTHLYIRAGSYISDGASKSGDSPCFLFVFSVGRESDHALSPGCLLTIFFLFPAAAADDTTRTGADSCGWARGDTNTRFVGLETPEWIFTLFLPLFYLDIPFADPFAILSTVPSATPPAVPSAIPSAVASAAVPPPLEKAAGQLTQLALYKNICGPNSNSSTSRETGVGAMSLTIAAVLCCAALLGQPEGGGVYYCCGRSCC